MLTVTVPGIPQPQGSVRSLGKGRPSVHGNAERLLPWRESVIWHVAQEMAKDPGFASWPLDGPIGVTLTFRLPRPKSASKGRWAPDRRPDIDKLSRAILDALTQAQAVWDDAQVVDLTARKVYAETGDTPGVTVHVCQLERDEAAA